MKPQYHLGISLAVSLALYAWLRDIALAVSSFAAGFLIDIDHYFDYVLTYGLRFNARHFYSSFYGAGEYTRIIIILHAWEWLAVLLAVPWWIGWNPVLTGALIGLGHHFLLDQIFNPAFPLTYFFTYRLRHGFKIDRIIAGGERTRG